jgi:hypothetical protein
LLGEIAKMVRLPIACVIGLGNEVLVTNLANAGTDALKPTVLLIGINTLFFALQ